MASACASGSFLSLLRLHGKRLRRRENG